MGSCFSARKLQNPESSVCRAEATSIAKAKTVNDLRSPGEWDLVVYTYEEMIVATNSFQSVLGRGGFGIFYEGFIGENVRVAIKERDLESKQGNGEWLTSGEKQICNKLLKRGSRALMKVLVHWENQTGEEATWEYSDEMLLQFPKFIELTS